MGLAIFCPATSLKKGYPFELQLPDSLEITGVILSDQVKSFDWKARNAQFICKLPGEFLDEVTGKLQTLIVKNR